MGERGRTAYFAEFLGTLLLVFVLGTVLSLHQVSSAGLGYQDYAVIGLVAVLALAVLVAALGPVSGGHFNPAVTLAFALRRRLRARRAVFYVLAQVGGAIAGARLVGLLLEDEGEAVGYGAPVVSEQFLSGSAGTAMVCELIGAFLLVWAYLAAAEDQRVGRPWIAGAALGLVVMIFGPLTGGAANPARAFGPALVGEAFGGAGNFLLAFVLGPLVGALLAAASFTVLRRAPGAKPDAPLTMD